MGRDVFLLGLGRSASSTVELSGVEILDVDLLARLGNSNAALGVGITIAETLPLLKLF